MKKVCVLMSTYNGEKFLEEQLDSILSQKGEFELDILIRDDGSSDNTINILKEYSKNANIKWYTGKNLKPAKSFMNLIMNVDDKYDYYLFADQDDFWYDNKIQKSIELLSEDVPSISYSNPEVVDSKLNYLGRKVYKRIPCNDIYSITWGCNIIGCTMCFNNRLLKIIKSKGMPDKIIMHDAYVSRVCVLVGGKIVYDDNSYMKYRQHGNNVLGMKLSIKAKILEKINDIFKKSDVTVDEQILEILRLYENIISEENKIYLKKVSNYRKNIFLRIAFACSTKTKYVSKNASIKYRMAILLGNR